MRLEVRWHASRKASVSSWRRPCRSLQPEADATTSRVRLRAVMRLRSSAWPGPQDRTSFTADSVRGVDRQAISTPKILARGNLAPRQPFR